MRSHYGSPRIQVKRLRRGVLTQDAILEMVPLEDRRALSAKGIVLQDLLQMGRLSEHEMAEAGRKVPFGTSDEEVVRLITPAEIDAVLLAEKIRHSFIRAANADWRTTFTWHNFSTRGMALWKRTDGLLRAFHSNRPPGLVPEYNSWGRGAT